MAWNVFQMTFLDRYFPFEMIETKVVEFMNLKEGSTLVKKYCLEFTQQSKYAPELLLGSRACIRKFFIRVFDLVVKECRNDIFISDMNITRLMTHV